MKSKALSLMSMAALVAACGGGGGGGVSDSLPPSSTLAQQCSPANPLAPSANRTASLDTERRWVRSYVDEAYLWYREVPTVDATRPEFNLSDVPIALDNYFLALTEEGVARDRFSFTYPTADWLALAQSGIVSGFGAEWLLGSATPPRNIRIAYVDPQTPAAAADLTRGMALVSVDGFSADDNTSAGIERLNEALFSPTVGRSYSFVLRDLQGVNRAVSMTAAQITKTPVQNLRTIDTPSGRVGYMSFHDHLVPAEGQLVSAFQSLASQNISDLVLDLRYNGGGYLYIASQVGYMIAGSMRTGGRTFERLLFNDKRTADNNDPDNNTPFYNVTSGFSGSGTTANQPLPQLSLNRLLGERGDRQRAARHQCRGGPDRRYDLWQALWLHGKGQLRHLVLPDRVPGGQRPGLRRLRKRLRCDLCRRRRPDARPGRQQRRHARRRTVAPCERQLPGRGRSRVAAGWRRRHRPRAAPPRKRKQDPALIAARPADAADPALPVRWRRPLEGERRSRNGGGWVLYAVPPTVRPSMRSVG
jgi:hypothetical protein